MLGEFEVSDVTAEKMRFVCCVPCAGVACSGSTACVDAGDGPVELFVAALGSVSSPDDIFSRSPDLEPLSFALLACDPAFEAAANDAPNP